MIFYGKAQRRVAVAAALGEVEGFVGEALSARVPVVRHAAWVSALVEAGGLAQGLADFEDVATVPQLAPPPAGGEPALSSPKGVDAKRRRVAGLGPARDDAPAADAESAGMVPPSPPAAPEDGPPRGEEDARSEDDAPSALAMALCLALAAVMGRSWDSAFADLPAVRPDAVAGALARLRASPGLPEAVDIRRTEGFSHYAVYPEAHWRAAQRLTWRRPARVLGLRSIGTTLAAAAAAAFEAPPPRTVRPRGHPFAREVEIAPSLDAAESAAVWAIVDEGPGLSGSSMGAAADALGAAGVSRDRIVLLPGHDGPPGPMASDAHRSLWATARLSVVPFEALALDGQAACGLAAWVADLTGPLLAPPEDVAAGDWRRHRFADEAAWPAADRQNERRKYLLRGERGTFLLRFAGLGSFGRAKLRRAEALAAAGFGVAPLGMRHGFLVEPWRADLRPVVAAEVDRPALLARLAGYLAFRAGAFPAGPDAGAPLAALLAMARANAAEILGDAASSRLDDWAGRLPDLARRARPVAIDGRLAPHEWLHDGAAPPLKADALDHCCGHDLVGCQDIAWDVAGAAVEWDLSDAEAEDLLAAVARGGARCDPGLVAFFRLAYPAFRAGALAMARDRERGAEADRLGAALRRQVAALRRDLA